MEYVEGLIKKYESVLKQEGPGEVLSLLENVLKEVLGPSIEKQKINQDLLERIAGGNNATWIYNAVGRFVRDNYDRWRETKELYDYDAQLLYMVAMKCASPSGIIRHRSWNSIRLPKGFGKKLLLLIEKYLFERGRINEKKYEQMVKRPSDTDVK